MKKYKEGDKVFVDGYGNGTIVHIGSEGHFHIRSDEDYEFPYRIFKADEFYKVQKP